MLEHPGGLLVAKRFQPRQHFRVAVGDDGGRQQRGIGGAGSADGESGHRNSGRHLHDGEQRIHAIQRLRLHRHAQHRQCGLRGRHARQMRRAAGAGDDGLESARARAGGIFKQQIRRAVRRNHPHLVRYAEGIRALPRRGASSPSPKTIP